ncbi:CRISPR-associated protein Csx20 [Caminibacter profundus]
MKLFLFFSHNLTQEQIKDAESLGINEFVSLPHKLQYLWSNVPPELEDLEEYVIPFYEFLNINAKKGDYVLVQGDFGLSCRLVNYSKQKGLIPIYATSKRVTKEIKKEDKVIKISEFKHIKFRRY